jgi:hypothetical protein
MIHTDGFTEAQMTMNSDHYIKTLETLRQRSLRIHCSGEAFILHHDNARPFIPCASRAMTAQLNSVCTTSSLTAHILQLATSMTQT